MWEVCFSIEANALHHPRRDHPMADGSQSLAWNPDQKNNSLLEPLAGCEVWTGGCFRWYPSPSLDLGRCCKLHQRPKHPCGMLRKCFGWRNQLNQEVFSFGAVQRGFLTKVSHFFWSLGNKNGWEPFCIIVSPANLTQEMSCGYETMYAYLEPVTLLHPVSWEVEVECFAAVVPPVWKELEKGKWNWEPRFKHIIRPCLDPNTAALWFHVKM